jgi:aspartyl-tRNA(Asn)/glutamyl-tRNA(Gln) amidotransferase subunit A
MTGPVEATERAIAKLGQDPWHAFLHVEPEAARERARALEAEGSRGRPLSGLVVSVKDNLAWAGRPMTCASKHLERYRAPYTADSVVALERAGAVILGKTNMDEFAAGSSGENSAFGATKNPRDPTRVPGGSSSGAGASVAAGVCDVALGSDTGGSVRCPAAFCGVAALKPTYGAISRHGLADLAMSLEGPAPLARDVATLERAMDALAGVRATPVAAPRIGVPHEFFDGVDDDVARPVRAALAKLQAKGATLVDVRIPSLRSSLAAYYVINYAEFASAMARYDGKLYGAPAPSRQLFGPEVKRRILLGTFVTSREERGAWYDAAVRVRAQVAREFSAALEGVDVLMGPTMPMRAFRLGERVADPTTMYAADVLTVSANLAGVPAGSVPLKVEGLPVGLQVIGRAGDDARVLGAMRLVEESSG